MIGNERAVYNSEDGRWYRQGDDPWTVRIVGKGEILKPLISARAYTSLDAFKSLFGHPLEIPPVSRSHRNHEAV
jgi:hypothetical protein